MILKIQSYLIGLTFGTYMKLITERRLVRIIKGLNKAGYIIDSRSFTYNLGGCIYLLSQSKRVKFDICLWGVKKKKDGPIYEADYQQKFSLVLVRDLKHSPSFSLPIDQFPV